METKNYDIYLICLMGFYIYIINKQYTTVNNNLTSTKYWQQIQKTFLKSLYIIYKLSKKLISLSKILN